MYCVYVLYGFASMSAINTIMSTLKFFFDQMPKYDPSFFFLFLWSVLAIFVIVIFIIYGYKLTWGFKNNMIIFLLIPLVLSLPILTYNLDSANDRFTAYTILLLVISILNSVQASTVYS